MDLLQSKNTMVPRSMVCYDDLLEPQVDVDPLEDQRVKAKKRAERFGLDYKEPRKNIILNRTELAMSRGTRDGFVTGIDVFSEEERVKREKRAAKFGGTLLGLTAEEVEKAEKMRLRAERFGPVEPAPPEDVAGSMDIDPLEARKEAQRDAAARMDAVYLYGVDTMSTKDCLAYFEEYGPRFVEWIDDSSCVVVFGDEFTARRIVANMGTPLALETQKPDSVPPELGQLFRWHQGPEFTKSGAAVSLQFRIATSADVKPSSGKQRSRHLWRTNPPGNLRGNRDPAKPRAGAKHQKRRRNQSAMDHDAGEEVAEPAVEAKEGEDLRSKLKSGDRDLRKMLEGPGRVKFFEDDEDYIPLDKESDEEMSLRKRNKIESEDKVV
mmetsp:Transcript_28228/g.53757  ORF Transcript_28228/g.53757 Transcript_28228/m.53757 type:complete len:380 (-) Transcript_28228:295-1434(-)